MNYRYVATISLMIAALSSTDARAAETYLRLGAPFKDHAVLQADRPIDVWGTFEDHGSVEVNLDGQMLISEGDSSGWWLVTFPARAVSNKPFDLKVKSGKEKITVSGLTTAKFPLLRPAAPFQDHAVLQRDRPIPVWGTCAPNAKIEAQLGGATVSATADASGKWKLTFAARPASADPITLTLTSGDEKIVINDILVGDVWVAGGQSNMEWVFKRLPEAASVSPKTNFPTIRYFTGPDLESGTPQSQRPGEWLLCSPERVGDFSGAAFYFARAMQERLNVPMGLLDLNWGGTKIEPWTPPFAFSAEPELADLADFVSKTHPDYPAGKTAQKAWLGAMQKWSEAASVLVEAGRPPGTPPEEPGVTSNLQRKQNPSRIYNAMVAPVVPYAVRGVIWYQGENNAGDALYHIKMKALVDGWRKLWGQELPFYYVQLANFNNGRPPEEPPFTDHPWAIVRETQRQAMSIPRTGMAVAIDLGDDSKNPHYKNKKDVGYRLAQWALHDEFGQKDIVPSGPLFDRAEVNSGTVRIHFRYAESGLITGTKSGREPVVKNDGPLRWVSFKGADGKWCEADAKIEGDTVVASCKEVPDPEEIAYAWAGFPKGANLYNGAGLPASPFRTSLKTPDAQAAK